MRECNWTTIKGYNVEVYGEKKKNLIVCYKDIGFVVVTRWSNRGHLTATLYALTDSVKMWRYIDTDTVEVVYEVAKSAVDWVRNKYPHLLDKFAEILRWWLASDVGKIVWQKLQWEKI